VNACADRDDRERLCPSAKHCALTGTISARYYDIPQRPARRPRRLDGTNARLVQARRLNLRRRDLRICPDDRREAAPGEATSGGMVRLRAPAGVGAVQTFSGLHSMSQPTAPSRCRNGTPYGCYRRDGSGSALEIRRSKNGFVDAAALRARLPSGLSSRTGSTGDGSTQVDLKRSWFYRTHCKSNFTFLGGLRHRIGQEDWHGHPIWLVTS
jgi:hypothetical protein